MFHMHMRCSSINHWFQYPAVAHVQYVSATLSTCRHCINYVFYIMCFILCGTFIVCKSSISQSILIQYMNVVEIYCVTSYYLCFKSSIINYPYYIRYHVAKCSEACPLYLHPLFAAPVMHGWIQKFCRFHLQQETATLWNLNGWPSDQSAFW